MNQQRQNVLIFRPYTLIGGDREQTKSSFGKELELGDVTESGMQLEGGPFNRVSYSKEVTFK